jgi:nucleotide-binding universal stress UspA family protein
MSQPTENFNKKKAGPIYWALDPFLENTELGKKTAELVTTLSNAFEANVQTATVLSPEQLNWPAQFQGDWESKFRAAVTRKIQDFLEAPTTGVEKIRSRLAPPLLLWQSESSLRRSVRTLVQSAEKAGAQMFVASTHARHGFSRLALGSFCESLAGASSVPVAIVNPSTEVSATIRTVLFPTDLSDESKKRLPEILDFTRAIGAKLHLMHKLLVPYPTLVEPGYLLAGADIGTVETLFASHREAQERTGKSWCEEIADMGVEAVISFSSGPGSIIDAILEAAEKQIDSVVAIPDQTGPLASVVLGHLSRSVARDSKRPVVIFPLIH